MNTKQIEASALGYRNTAKFFYRGQYHDRLKPYTYLIQATMKANNIEVIPAILKIMETSMYKESGVARMFFMAAAAELIDPSLPPIITRQQEQLH